MSKGKKINSFSIFTLVFLLSLIAITLITVCNVFGKQPAKLVSSNQSLIKDNYTSGLNIGWQTNKKTLNLRGIEEFIKENNIQIISFIDDKGTMYLTDKTGKEIGFEQKDGKSISRWCKIAGTQVQDGCLNIKSHTITNINNMTTIVGHGSPYRIIIQVDGHAVCWDLVDQKICD